MKIKKQRIQMLVGNRHLVHVHIPPTKSSTNSVGPDPANGRTGPLCSGFHPACIHTCLTLDLRNGIILFTCAEYVKADFI